MALKLSLSNSLSSKYFLSLILFLTQPCSATILLPTLCLPPPTAALNISKSAPIFLSVVSWHIPFHLFTTLPPPTKEPLYIWEETLWSSQPLSKQILALSLPYSALLRRYSISYTLSFTTCRCTQYFKVCFSLPLRRLPAHPVSLVYNTSSSNQRTPLH